VSPAVDLEAAARHHGFGGAGSSPAEAEVQDSSLLVLRRPNIGRRCRRVWCVATAGLVLLATDLGSASHCFQSSPAAASGSRERLLAAFGRPLAAGPLGWRGIYRSALGGAVPRPRAGGAALRSASAQQEGDTSGQDWRRKVGKAIDTLKADVIASANDEADWDLSIFSQDVVLDLAQFPSLRVTGLVAYRRALDTLHWSMRSLFEGRRVEVLSISAPTNGVVYMRWRIHLLPRDHLAPARRLLASMLDHHPLLSGNHRAPEPEDVWDGYSCYEFDPWTADIVRHTIDLKSPPRTLQGFLGVAGDAQRFQVGFQVSPTLW